MFTRTEMEVPAAGGAAGVEDKHEHVINEKKNVASGDRSTLPWPNASDMESYSRSGLQLIPLHRWNASNMRGKNLGKVPRDPRWQQRPYDNRSLLLEAKRTGINLGVRLAADVVVVDVDPRNFNGTNTLDDLTRELDLDFSVCPHTITGSGGDHFWFRKPVDIMLVDSLTEFPGIEFKSLGRQVVAAGSIHPNGNRYDWDDFAPLLHEMPMAPERLLSLIRRPARVHGDAAGLGEMSPERLAETLKGLDPEDFKDHEAWLKLMMACHHATAGEGRQEFIDWSTADPDYQDKAREIGYRWDSLHTATKSRPITIKYLYKVVQDAGATVAQVPPEEDFEEVPGATETTLPAVSRNRAGKPINSLGNCLAFLRHANSRLGLSYDEFSQRAQLMAQHLPWKVDVGREVTDDLIRVIRHFLLEQFGLEASKENVTEAVLTLARENPFHPVRQYLDLLQWDGVPRLDNLMTTYLGASDSPYARAIGAKMMIAAVRRIRLPGTKFDNVVVLEGSQGTLKSSAIRTLTPQPDWFSDAELSRGDNKDAVLLLQGAWIIELGEMSVMSASEVEALKAFASRQVDRVRVPYGRLPVNLPRQCIFIGTTNKSGYLRDQTGNRRFWPVQTGKVDLDAIKRDRDQLWAEAVAREASGEACELPRDLWDMAAQEQEQRLVEDPWTDRLRDYVEGSGDGINGGRVDKVSSADLLRCALNIEVSRQTQKDSRRLREVMENRLGWKYKKAVRIGSSTYAGYERPRED